MSIVKLAGVSAALIACAAGAQAQSTSTEPVNSNAPAPSVVPQVAPSGQAVLRTGTEVPLRLSEQLTTKNKAVRVGQRFRMTVAEDIKVDGQTVIPVGSPAMGEITDVRNKGMWGKSGHIGAQILYVQVNGRQIRLSGTFDDKGVTGTAGVVAAIALVPIAGFFTTGTSANIPSGGAVKGFVDEDVPLSFAAPAAPTPLVVAPASAPMSVPAAVPSPAPTAPVPADPAQPK
jgi:hypothetical protein